MPNGGYAGNGRVDGIERRVRANTDMLSTMSGAHSAMEVLMSCFRAHLAVGATPAILLGGSSDIVITWPDPGFVTPTYQVEIIPTGLLGKGTYVVLAQDESTVTVRVTATVLIGLGTQFLVFGASNLS